MDTILECPNDILRLLYWLYFKPLTLRRYVQTIDSQLDEKLELWKLRQEVRAEPRGSNLFRLTLILQSSSVILVVLLLGILIEQFSVLSFDWQSAMSIALGWSIGSLIGVGIRWKGLKRLELWTYFMFVGAILISLLSPILAAFNPNLFQLLLETIVQIFRGTVLLYLALGLAISMVSGALYGVAFGVALGVAFGFGFGIGSTYMVGVACGIAYGIAAGVGSDAGVDLLVGVYLAGLFGISRGVADGITIGVTFEIAYVVTLLRLPMYAIELPYCLIISTRAESNPKRAHEYFQSSPIHWDELIWLPLIGLDEHLIAIGKQNRQSAQRAIADVAQSFRQQWAATNALIELTAYDVERAQNAQAIANIAEQFVWLPPTMPRDLETVLPPIREIAQYAQAALESDTLYNRQTQFRNAISQTQRVREGLGLSQNRQIAARFGPVLEAWEQALSKELGRLSAREVIPNVYVAGSPLAIASKVFKGRHDLFVSLERELASDAEQRPTLLLFGARRSGKTSAIKQMPVRLGPDVIPVEVDLQSAATAEDVHGLLFVLADQIKRNALTHRRVQLPALTRDDMRADPYVVFGDWLNRVEEAVGTRWILLNLDEYERLTEMMDAGRIDQRMFDFLRGIIQHHPRVTVLLSGSHTLEDLPPIWSDYLINVRVLKIENLKEDEARELIVKPIENFPLQYEPAAVGRMIAATGCQPYLLQATCRDLVNLLNEENRTTATLADADRALDSVLTTGVAYFQELWAGRDTDDAQRAVMRAIATQKAVEVLNATSLQAALRKLVHRDILAATVGTYRFRVELVRRWVERSGN